MWKCCRSKGLTLFLFLLCSLTATNLWAATYYISSSGSDMHDGQTPATAWRSISKLNSVILLPGDQVFFEGGAIFAGNIQLDENEAGDPLNPVVFSSFGSGRAVINAGLSYGFYAYNTAGFSISNLIFDGQSMLTNNNAGIKIFSDRTGASRSKFISINNVEVRQFGQEGVTIYTNAGLPGFEDVNLDYVTVHDVQKNGIVVYVNFLPPLTGAYAHKNVSIRNCQAYNIPGKISSDRLVGNGIVICGADAGLIESCVAHDNGQDNTYCGGPAGIWTLESDHIIIQHCESYKNHQGSFEGTCDGAGFDLDGGVTNSTMQYNYSHDNDGAGFLMGQFPDARPWGNNTVRYNISVNDGITNEASIGLFKGERTTMDGVNIYNNTVYVSPQALNGTVSAAQIQTWNTGIDHVAFYNNIFIAANGAPLINIPPGYSALFAGNLYWTPGGTFLARYRGTDYSSLDAFRTGTSNEKVNGVNTGIYADPLLTNIGSHPDIGYGVSVQTLNAYKVINNSSPAVGAALDINALYSIDPGLFDFWGTALAGGSFNSIGGNQYVSALPVTLLSFHGNCSGTQNTISWITAEEANMKSFELMYSNDGKAFRKIADIDPRGSHSQYRYTNDSASAGANYYQLKMTDLDGSYRNSAVLNIRCGASGNKINVWPNPFVRSLTVSIESTTPGMADLIIYDATGKTVIRKESMIWTGNNPISLDGLDALPAGSYYLRVIQQQKTEYIKLIKSGN